MKLFQETTPVNYVTRNFVPMRYYPFLYDLNFLYSQPNIDNTVILKRKDEIQRIFNCFLRTRKRNAILIGEHGVGKTAIVKKIVYMVTHGRCPNELKNYHFICLNIQGILASDLSDKKIIRKINDIMNFIQSYNDFIVVIDQVHLVQSSYLLSYYFQILIQNPRVALMGLTTEDEFYDYFELDLKIRSRLETIYVREPKSYEIYPMIKRVVKVLEKSHDVKISKEMIQYIISISNAFHTEIAEPEFTLDIIEKSMIYAKRTGSKLVTRKFVNKNFKFNYKLYKRMSIEDKKIVAYHEAGHFIVNKLSENIRNLKTTAITIIPAEDFLGVTTFEFEPESIC